MSLVQSFKNYDKDQGEVDTFLVLSQNPKLLERISDKLNKPVYEFNTETILNLGDKNVEIIFDNDYISFKKIIRKMQELKNERITFKIKPKSCNYMLGSDFSDGKGEVIIF